MSRTIIIDNSSWSKATAIALGVEEAFKQLDIHEGIVVGLDTSMSISVEELQAFQKEIEFVVRDTSYLRPIQIEPYDDLPTNTTKPKFIMARDHHIRKVRR